MAVYWQPGSGGYLPTQGGGGGAGGDAGGVRRGGGGSAGGPGGGGGGGVAAASPPASMLRPAAGYPLPVTLPSSAMARIAAAGLSAPGAGGGGGVPPPSAATFAAAAAYSRQQQSAAVAAAQADPRAPRLSMRPPFPFIGQDGVQLLGVGAQPALLTHAAVSAAAGINSIVGNEMHAAAAAAAAAAGPRRRGGPVVDARHVAAVSAASGVPPSIGHGAGSGAGGPTAPLTIETRDTKESAGYQPQVEAISPTPEDRPAERDDIKSTKDNLLQKIAKVDREIAKAESQIAKLKKKQEELEDAANKPSTDSASEDEKPNQSIAQNVYSENRRKAAQSHAMLNKFSPGNLLPLYNQPSDTELYNKNKKEYTVFKEQLKEYFKRKNEEQESRDRYLTLTYCKLSSAWNRKVDRIEGNKKRREREAKSREMYEKLFPELRKQREDKERNERLGTRGTVRSDQEIQDVIDRIQEHELEEKKMHSYAVVPPPLLPPEDRKRKYMNKNGLMADPLLVYNERKFVNMWTDAEKETFKEKYLQHPKNFFMIAQYLERKSVSDCVQYYYLSKKTENYKQMLRKSRPRGGTRTRRINNPTGGEVIAPNVPGVVTRRTVAGLQEKEGDGSKGVSRSNTPQPNNKTSDKDGDETANGEKETGRPRRGATNKKVEQAESSDDEDSNQAVKCGPFPCVVCKTTVESSRPVTKAQAAQLGVKEEDISDASRVCSTCWCKTLRTKCPLLSCSTASSKSKKLRHLPAKWKDLSPAMKETVSNELQIPEGTKQVCTTCFGRINKRISQALEDEANGVVMDIKTTSSAATTNNGDKTNSSSAANSNSSTPQPRDSKETYKVGDVVWSAEEVVFLEMGLRTEGKDWTKVASKVPEKSSSECRKFFYQHRKKLELDDMVAEYKKTVPGGGKTGDKPSLSSDEEEYSTTSSCEEEGADKKKDGKSDEKNGSDIKTTTTPNGGPTSTSTTTMSTAPSNTTINAVAPPTAMSAPPGVGGKKEATDGYDSAATVSADETLEQDKKQLQQQQQQPLSLSTVPGGGGPTVVTVGGGLGFPPTSQPVSFSGKTPLPPPPTPSSTSTAGPIVAVSVSGAGFLPPPPGMTVAGGVHGGALPPGGVGPPGAPSLQPLAGGAAGGIPTGGVPVTKTIYVKDIMNTVIDESLRRPSLHGNNARAQTLEVSSIKDLLDQQHAAAAAAAAAASGAPPTISVNNSLPPPHSTPGGVGPPPSFVSNSKAPLSLSSGSSELEVKYVTSSGGPAPPPSQHHAPGGPPSSHPSATASPVVVEDSGVLNLTTSKRDRSPQLHHHSSAPPPPPPSHHPPPPPHHPGVHHPGSEHHGHPLYGGGGSGGGSSGSSYIERGAPGIHQPHPIPKGEKPPDAHSSNKKTTHNDLMKAENRRLLNDFALTDKAAAAHAAHAAAASAHGGAHGGGGPAHAGSNSHHSLSSAGGGLSSSSTRQQDLMSSYHKSYGGPPPGSGPPPPHKMERGSITTGQPIPQGGGGGQMGNSSSSRGYHPGQMKQLPGAPRGSLVTGTPVYTDQRSLNSSDPRSSQQQSLEILRKQQQNAAAASAAAAAAAASKYPQYPIRPPPHEAVAAAARGNNSRRVIENDYMTAKSLPRKDTAGGSHMDDLRGYGAHNVADLRGGGGGSAGGGGSSANDRDIQIVETPHSRFDPRHIYGNPRGPHPFGSIRTDPKADIPPRDPIRSDPRAELQDPRYQPDPRSGGRPPPPGSGAGSGGYPGYPNPMSLSSRGDPGSRSRSPPRSLPNSRAPMPGGVGPPGSRSGITSGLPRSGMDLHRGGGGGQQQQQQPEVSITKQTVQMSRPDYPTTTNLASLADIAVQQPKMTDLTRPGGGSSGPPISSGPGTSSGLTVTRTDAAAANASVRAAYLAATAKGMHYDPRYLREQHELLKQLTEADKEKLKYPPYPDRHSINADQLIDMIVSKQVKDHLQPTAAAAAAAAAGIPMSAVYGAATVNSLVAASAGMPPRLDGKESPSKQPSRSPLVKDGLEHDRNMMLRTSPAGVPNSMDNLDTMKKEMQKHRTSPYPIPLTSTAASVEMLEYWKRSGGKFPPGAVDPAAAAYMAAAAAASASAAASAAAGGSGAGGGPPGRPPSQGGMVPRPNSRGGMPAPTGMGPSDERQIIRVAQNASPRSDKGSSNSIPGGRPMSGVEAISPPTSDPSRSTPNYNNYPDMNNSISRILASQAAQRKSEIDPSSMQVRENVKRKIDEAMKNNKALDPRTGGLPPPHGGVPANLTMGPPNKRPIDSDGPPRHGLPPSSSAGGLPPSQQQPADLSAESPRKRHKPDDGGHDLPDSPGSGEMVIDEGAPARPDSAPKSTSSPAPHPSDYSNFRGGGGPPPPPTSSAAAGMMPARSSPSINNYHHQPPPIPSSRGGMGGGGPPSATITTSSSGGPLPPPPPTSIAGGGGSLPPTSAAGGGGGAGPPSSRYEPLSDDD